MSEQNLKKTESKFKETMKALGRGIERAAPTLRNLAIFAAGTTIAVAFGTACKKASQS